MARTWLAFVIGVGLATAAVPVRGESLAGLGAGGGRYRARSGSSVASVWFDALYDVVRSEALPPPQASRIYGLTAVSVYEAVVPGSRHRRSLAGQLAGVFEVPEPGRGRHHWPSVANAAAAATIRGLLPAMTPENLGAVNALEGAISAYYRHRIGAGVHDRSVRQGRAVAASILAWAATDGYATFNNCPYVPAPVAGAWEPTPPASAPPLQPCWGGIRPMVLPSSDACQDRTHLEFSTQSDSPFFQAAAEVYNTGLALTEEQRTIATYWADGSGVTGTPAGHWIAIVGQIVRKDRLSLAASAEAFARTGIAVHDAFIQCWRTKFDTNLQRPVTYIRNHIDASWSPFVATPPFPTYTSGHSTQSGAVAAVLTRMFGRRSFVDTLHADHDLTPRHEPRFFRSFNHAAREAAVSRLYGGIHYTFDNDDGLVGGACVGRMINQRLSFER